ncbi:MAG: manganese efflux pump MntP family protein [Thermodesulfobacteriota bacterium]
MHMITIVFIALGLAMDALAVSIASGGAIRHLTANGALKIAVFFGSFQAVMPFIGWSAGLGMINLVSGVDHWVAFAILCFIGCKMIYESRKIGTKGRKTNPLNTSVLLMLSVATSIDALAVGVSFGLLKVFIVTPIIVIGMVTFLLSFIGVFVGDKYGHLFENKIEIIGGVTLICIGMKILLEHLVL